MPQPPKSKGRLQGENLHCKLQQQSGASRPAQTFFHDPAFHGLHNMMCLILRGVWVVNHVGGLACASKSPLPPHIRKAVLQIPKTCMSDCNNYQTLPAVQRHVYPHRSMSVWGSEAAWGSFIVGTHEGLQRACGGLPSGVHVAE
jgi:hypothetical protein